MPMDRHKHTLVAQVEDRPGVLNRVVSLFRRRGFNIESLTVGHCETPGVSRMTIVVDARDTAVDQVAKQLDKLVDVLRVADISDAPLVARELALVKIAATSSTRFEIMQLVDIYRAKIVDVAQDSIMVEITGPEAKIDSFLELVHHFGVKEMVRTGRVALVRGTATIPRKDEHRKVEPAGLRGPQRPSEEEDAADAEFLVMA